MIPIIFPYQTETGAAYRKDVNLYDYDGTLLHSYTLAEAQSLSTLPTGPVREGLTFQGWNYSLANINAATRSMNIGAVYITADGKTHLHIVVWDMARSMVPLYFQQDVSGGVVIDWGDGSTTETVEGTGAVNTSHQFTATGVYDITLDVDNGCALMLGDGIQSSVIGGSDLGYGYATLLYEVNLGARASLSPYALYSSGNLLRISIPEGALSIPDGACQDCLSLAFAVLPSSVTNLGGYAFKGNHALKSIIFPNGLSVIGEYACSEDYSISFIVLPDGVTSIGQNAFASLYVSTLTIPSGVETIAAIAFGYCMFIKAFYVLPTTPPTIDSSFDGYPEDCIIYVPSTSVNTYKSTSGWTAYADNIQGL